MILNRYELQSRKDGQIELVFGIFASTDEEAITEVKESVEVARERGASDLKLYEIGIGFERLVRDYAE